MSEYDRNASAESAVNVADVVAAAAVDAAAADVAAQESNLP